MPASHMPMIERVARSLAEALGSDDWRSLAPAARAAVAAMREPTPEMLKRPFPIFPIGVTCRTTGAR